MAGRSSFPLAESAVFALCRIYLGGGDQCQPTVDIPENVDVTLKGCTPEEPCGGTSVTSTENSVSLGKEEVPGCNGGEEKRTDRWPRHLQPRTERDQGHYSGFRYRGRAGHARSPISVVTRENGSLLGIQHFLGEKTPTGFGRGQVLLVQYLKPRKMS